MRELVYYVAVSIDGFIAEPDGSFDAFPTEGDHMRYLIEEFTDALPTHVLQALGISAPHSLFDAVIQGRNSYEIARAAGITNPYAHLEEYVATSARFDEVTTTTNALQTVRELKQQPGLAIYLCGGGTLAGSLLPEIDRLILKRNPVILGDGIKLFANTTLAVQNFRLVSCNAFDSGVIIEHYAR